MKLKDKADFLISNAREVIVRLACNELLIQVKLALIVRIQGSKPFLQLCYLSSLPSNEMMLFFKKIQKTFKFDELFCDL